MSSRVLSPDDYRTQISREDCFTIYLLMVQMKLFVNHLNRHFVNSPTPLGYSESTQNRK